MQELRAYTIEYTISASIAVDPAEHDQESWMTERASSAEQPVKGLGGILKSAADDHIRSHVPGLFAHKVVILKNS